MFGGGVFLFVWRCCVGDMFVLFLGVLVCCLVCVFCLLGLGWYGLGSIVVVGVWVFGWVEVVFWFFWVLF